MNVIAATSGARKCSDGFIGGNRSGRVLRLLLGVINGCAKRLGLRAVPMKWLATRKPDGEDTYSYAVCSTERVTLVLLDEKAPTQD